MARRVRTIQRDGEAVQWSGWNEKEVEDLFHRYAPGRLIAIVPMTDPETGVRTLDLYILYDNGEDRVIARGDWFVGQTMLGFESYIVVVPDERFTMIFETME